MIELTEILFPWHLPDSSMFDILKNCFEMLDKGGNTDIVPVFFEIAAMSLGGYGINIEKCSICGRKYLGQGTAVFLPDRGSIACMKCQEITKMTPAMCPETVRTINTLQTCLSHSHCGDGLSPEFFNEIKPVLKLHREYRLEKSPKSANYFE